MYNFFNMYLSNDTLFKINFKYFVHTFSTYIYAVSNDKMHKHIY